MIQNQSPILLRINADNSNKRVVGCFWLVFSIFVLSSGILAWAISQEEIIVKKNETELEDTDNKPCMNPYEFDDGKIVCGEFNESNRKVGLVMRDLSALNIGAYLYLEFGGKLPKQQELNLTLYSVEWQRVPDTDTAIFQKGEIIHNQSHTFKPHHDSEIYELGYFHHFQHENYLLTIAFEDIEGMDLKPPPELLATLFNPHFIVFTIVFRGSAFMIMLFTTILYLWNLRKLNPEERSTEQKLVIALSISLLFFNDPLYSLTILQPSVALTAISTLFFSQFIVFLIFFWTIGADRILNQEGTNHCKLGTGKLCGYGWYFFAFLGLFVAFYTKIGLNELEVNTLLPPYQVSLGLFITFLLFLVLSFVYMVYLYAKILCGERTLLWRSSLWMSFNCYFMVMILITLLLDSLGLYHSWSARVVLFQNAMNLYTIYMQYMFSSPPPSVEMSGIPEGASVLREVLQESNDSIEGDDSVVVDFSKIDYKV